MWRHHSLNTSLSSEISTTLWAKVSHSLQPKLCVIENWSVLSTFVVTVVVLSALYIVIFARGTHRVVHRVWSWYDDKTIGLPSISSQAIKLMQALFCYVDAECKDTPQLLYLWKIKFAIYLTSNLSCFLNIIALFHKK